MNKALRIGVALCSCNGEKYLRQQIDSILGQSIPVDEIVVGDDVSQDQTKQILLDYDLNFPGLFRITFHTVRLGAVRNFEFVLANSSAELVFLCDQDDVWRPTKVAVMSRTFSNPACLMTFTDGNLIDGSGASLNSTLWEKWDFNALLRVAWRLFPQWAVRDLLLNKNKVTGATVALRRSLIQATLPIRAPNGFWHDAWFALHAAARHGLVFIPDRLIDYRVHGGQQVGITRGGNTLTDAGVSWDEFANTFVQRYPRFRVLIFTLKLYSRFRAIAIKCIPLR